MLSKKELFIRVFNKEIYLEINKMFEDAVEGFAGRLYFKYTPYQDVYFFGDDYVYVEYNEEKEELKQYIEWDKEYCKNEGLSHKIFNIFKALINSFKLS